MGAKSRGQLESTRALHSASETFEMPELLS
jgi:hypothetical protein